IYTRPEEHFTEPQHMGAVPANDSPDALRTTGPTVTCRVCSALIHIEGKILDSTACCEVFTVQRSDTNPGSTSRQEVRAMPVQLPSSMQGGVEPYRVPTYQLQACDHSWKRYTCRHSCPSSGGYMPCCMRALSGSVHV
uniref:Phosphatidylinositol-4,5-bisphosphate 4-phosphatase n=1 Tax=Parascaris univalens TaxID=6257 RepID=A0A915BKG6_PARUN